MDIKTPPRRSVPVLITWDIDPDQWMPFERRRKALYVTLELCKHYHIPATFYITAQPALDYANDFTIIRDQGCEIGCHGYTHGNEENYNRMPEAMQREYISRAAAQLQSMLGEPIRAFRSPRVKTSAQTLTLLAEYGFWSDSSVCSQRMDLVSSNLINWGWLIAPRRPYRPHPVSAFMRGNVPLWEIPVSALVAPFISSLLNVVGLSTMKRFFRLLYSEAQHTGKPIVYLAHPIEFAPMGKGKRSEPLQHKYFSLSYIRSNGFRLRRLLFRSGAKLLLKQTDELFAYMASFPDVTFMTASEYVRHCDVDEEVTGIKRV